MNLGNKKKLASRTLNVGKERIVFLTSRLNEIKESITRQDMKDLKEAGAIIIKEIKGRRKEKKSSKKRGPGKIKKKVSKRKERYVIMTRKLRKYALEKEKKGDISKEDIKDMRKKIRNKFFRSKNHLKEYIGSLKK